MPQPITMTPTRARRLAITRQRLTRHRLAPDADGIMTVFRDLGCVQLDPINAVARTHLLVLWSRLGAFNRADLRALRFETRHLLEYWAHAASIVLTEDFPIYQWRMRRWPEGDSPWAGRVRAWLEEHQAWREHILTRLAQDGPLPSNELEDRAVRGWGSSNASAGWNSNQNVRQMLSFLWSQGEIMVAHRQGLRRFWHLAEHCLPDWTPRDDLSEREVVTRAAQRALRALGVATAKQIKQHFIRDAYPNLDDVLASLLDTGQIQPVSLYDGEAWFIHAADVPLLDSLDGAGWQPRTTLLSPFDNLICDRERTEQLFDFRYRVEIYVPKAKRQYGYYVLPILHGDRLIGRIDPKMDRKTKRLHINAVYAEADAPTSRETAQAIAQAINELGAFLGAAEIVYTAHVPDFWREALR